MFTAKPVSCKTMCFKMFKSRFSIVISGSHFQKCSKVNAAEFVWK